MQVGRPLGRIGPLVGCAAVRPGPTRAQLLNEDRLAILDHEEKGAPKGKIIVGRMLARMDDNYLDQNTLKFKDLVDFLDDFPYDKEEAIIFTGTMLT